jgi:SAM-dependent methyltransferase
MSDITVRDDLRANYDDYYQGDESEWRRLGAQDKAANIVALCQSVAHCTILDIGSGEGAVLQRLADVGFGQQFYALEISSTGVEAIRRRNLASLADCRLFDGYTIPYPDRQFDLALLSHVVEHVEHPRQLLYEAGRVADHVFVEVPLEDTLRLPGNYHFDRVGHINFYTPKTIRLLLQTCGFQVVAETITNPSAALFRYQAGAKGTFKHTIKDLLLRLSPQLATRLLTYHAALLCQSPRGQTGVTQDTKSIAVPGAT